MIKSWVRRAVISLLTDDSGDDATVQITYNGVSNDANRFSPYGLSSAPPIGAKAIVLYPSGRQDAPIVLSDDQAQRFKGLKEGEVQVGNYLTGASVKFNEDGEIELVTRTGQKMTIDTGSGEIDVTSGDVSLTSSGNVTVEASGNADVTAAALNLTAPTVTINGNLVVTGTITGTLDVLGGPLSTSLASHTHTITGGSSAGTTSAPNP